MKYIYFLLLTGTLLFPLLYSFDKRISFYRRWPALFSSLIPVALFFVAWDVWFTKNGVWSFNKAYVTGIFLLGLPLEEWLFFIIVPYSCIFIYDALKYFLKKDFLQPYSKACVWMLILVLLVLAFIYASRAYTFVTFSMTALFLMLHYLLFKDRFLGRFFLAYLVHLIPFFIVNGVLTSFPVVSYNDAENLGIRLGTIPVEDSIYSMLLLLMNITFYEYLNVRKAAVNTTKISV